MNIDKRWFMLVAVSVIAAIGAAVASRSGRRRRGIAHDQEPTAEHKSWENEGGNLAPTPVAPQCP